MELIYSMRRKPLKCEPPHFENVSDPEVIRPICTISISNIIAFSSPTELEDVEGETWGGHVYVCDLDTPWDSHKVASTRYPVSVVEWDSSGKQLVIATTEGEVFVYGQKDHLLNDWTCLYTAKFAGEHMLRAVFFHPGRRVVAVDKKGDAPIGDRVQVLRATPTLKGFGGVWCEGLCVVTATGLVCGLTPPAPAPAPAPAAPADPPQAHTVTETLRAHRDHLTNAAFAHRNGGLLLAVVESSNTSSIRCFLVSPWRGGGGAVAGGGAGAALSALHVQPLPAVRVQCTPHTTVWWSVREEPPSLAVCGQCGPARALSLWRLSDRAVPVHKLLAKGPAAGNTTPGGGPKSAADCFNTVTWQQAGVWAIEKDGGVPVGAAGGRAGAGPHHLVLATTTALHLLARDSHHYVCRVSVVSSGGAEGAEGADSDGTPPKRRRPGAAPKGAACAAVCSVSVSALGALAVAADTRAQLHLFRLPQPWHDIPSPLGVSQACAALELGVVCGGDCAELLLGIRPALAEALYDRITESFQRQPQSFQQYYYHAWLKLRMTLCRMCPSLQASASWLTCAQSVAAAWAAVAVCIRCDDRPEYAPLVALVDETAELDKAVLTVEAKIDLLSEPLQPLQGLRRVLQRVWDIAATLLGNAVTSHHQPHQHGYELLKDPVALSQLRRVLAVSRGLGMDPNLSRLIARLSACNTPKPDLLEECASVWSQWGGARLWEALPRAAVSAPHKRPPPYYLEYGVEPESLKYSPEPPGATHCEVAPSTTMDGIRYLYLGGGGRVVRWRGCGRCGSRALPHAAPSRLPHMRAYEARFISNCRCGGKWTLKSNV